MPKKLTPILFSILFAVTLTLPFLVYAQDNYNNPCPPGRPLDQCQAKALQQIGDQVGWEGAGEVTDTAISQKIGQIISYILAFLGVIFLVLVVISGIQWMTAGGNEEKVSKSRTRLVNATIGLAIVMAAYAITWFVVDKLQNSISEGGNVLASCHQWDDNSYNCLEHTNMGCQFVNNICKANPSSCQSRLPGDCSEPNDPNTCSGNACQLKTDRSGCECQQ